MLAVEKITVERGRRRVLNDVSLSLKGGQTLAVVGESGAGKSTLIAAVLGLVCLAHGSITWNEKPVGKVRPSLVMQEPRSAFNPHQTLMRSVLEPVLARRQSVDHARLDSLCENLDLPIDLLERKPTQVSIGQAQRVGILRALISTPPLILFDEPLSALDAVSQKQTARLIADLQQNEGFAALVVTHDLGYAAAHSDQIIVLRAGRVEESAPTDAFIEAPQTEYGQQLRDAAFALGAIGRAA
ncbi:MAG: ATP-binding cassette domain-containing protein [Pseudomonadota bacterium]